MNSISTLSHLAHRPQAEITETEALAFVEALLADERVESAEYAGVNDWGQQHIKVKMKGLNDARTIGGIVAHINRLDSDERKKREKAEKAAKKRAKAEAAAAKEPKISFVDYLRYFANRTPQQAHALLNTLSDESSKLFAEWQEKGPSLALPADVVEQRKGLEGTDAQIAWAADIRAEKLEGVSDEDRDAVLKFITDAKYWITMKSAASDDFVDLAKRRQAKA